MSRVKERAAARSITEAVVQGEVTDLLLLLFGACVRSHHKTPFCFCTRTSHLRAVPRVQFCVRLSFSPLASLLTRLLPFPAVTHYPASSNPIESKPFFVFVRALRTYTLSRESSFRWEYRFVFAPSLFAYAPLAPIQQPVLIKAF